MTTLSRRQFLKAACLAGTSALVTGCSEPVRRLIPYLIPPEDIVPGEATWYATTCRECPAGCGILAKNRDGRVIKVEGNPLHPVNAGKLCARGQASVQGIYNPDRFREPMRRDASGKLKAVSWEEAERVLSAALGTVLAGKGARKVVFLTDLVTGSEQTLITRWLAVLGGGQHLRYEPLAYEALRKANEMVFGVATIPSYHIEKADFLISFGADFLETWISNVEFARQFASFHEPKTNTKHFFAYVGPRLSLTAANADHWIQVPAGGESIVALGFLRLVLDSSIPFAVSPETRARLKSSVAAFTPDMVRHATGVDEEALTMLARRFSQAQKPLVLAQGMAYQDPQALETAVAANILCSLNEGSREAVDFSDPSSLSTAARAGDIKQLADTMLAEEVGLLLVSRANPVFHLPPSWQFPAALQKVPLVVSLSSFRDETGEYAQLVLPSHTFLESWGDYSPRPSIRGLLQPVSGPILTTRNLGDILIGSGKSIRPAAFPESDFYEMVRNSWKGMGTEPSGATSPDVSWNANMEGGGTWGKPNGKGGKAAKPSGTFAFFRAAAPQADARKGLVLISYPTVQFFDGRTANRPFLQEMPDPVTMITWAGWIEINPEDARRLNVARGDLLTIRSGSAAVKASAYPYAGIAPGTVAMPIGHGHSAFGRYSRNEAGNPLALGPGRLDPAGGLVATLPVTVEKTGSVVPVANTDGSGYQHGRMLARSISFEDYKATMGQPPSVVMPLPEGFSQERDFYAPHEHDTYRWGMVVDLDRCIGCQACVVACYAENNVGIVGRKEVLRGREMSWLHIERYFEPDQPFIRFLPMLCQHCDEAPCEAVCPVFAPHHSREGLNNQVYNRCVGTRFCSQNCPWKVRRFNWFTWTHDAPLEWQLNPDVTVRTKGVMEKCSFCIQRIVSAKMTAKNEGRLVRDGEFTTACAQTCPADALVFGNLKDPQSRVSKLARQARAYQVLGGLNTKPAVIYLKKITQKVKA